ncbi:DUF1758 domain-containing protein [Trichonephila inaurata madagascariensis]|uniref:DUF1758 domain-containing protein n=1 Tax=Trichonephila inaurata madagascariensis TaxID=2747483 RepID=A0A8X6MBJ3_9ARAC|nr:DUF1758 domain-containing protein [Trichonephila inaurata madagascariensis]
MIEALEISKATLSLPNPDARAETETKGLRLTFSCVSENCKISLLMGSDFYWSLTHRIKRLDSSLVAIETSLGWGLFRESAMSGMIVLWFTVKRNRFRLS